MRRKMKILFFVFGLSIGTTLGIFVAALMHAASRDKEKEENE